MVEIAVSGLIKVTLERLASPIMEQLWLFWGLQEDIENLSRSLNLIMAVLSDAEEKQQKKSAVKIWLKQVKQAAYDADDILDEYESEALRRKLETEGRFTEKVRDFFSASNPIVFDLLMAHKVKDIRKRLSKIAEEGSHLGLRVGEMSSEVTSPGQTDSHVSESDVKGREEDKEKIVELLLNMGNEEKVWIISIVGMGGLGKTTLAQLVYNDTRVREKFGDRIWVCVSDDYDMPRLTKKIIESATRSKCDDDNMELLQSRLREKLSGKKFFLVLDDVWNKKPFEWGRLKSYLQAGEMGSKILVTTRSEEDASMVGTHRLYPLSGLSEDDCWYLFHQQAFGQGQEEDPKLVDIGKEIVKRCGGLPLAVKAVGGLMHRKRRESEWMSVRDSEIWNDLPEQLDCIFPALRLSYNDLPSHLKPCFAYCSIFPKDHQIQVEELVQLWMAEGFIHPPQGNGLMEDTGRDYFKSLLQRSFFQDAERDGDGNAVSCEMHDLMHDLAELVSEDARSVVSEDGKIIIPDECRHLSVEIRCQERVSITLMPSGRAKKLRTLLLLGFGNCVLSHKFATHLPCLRVLVFDYERLSEDTLNSISGLKQLRYLCFNVSGVEILSNSLSKLHNLQTLRLISCEDLNELPRDMRKMVSLRHLQIEDCKNLTRMPAKMGELTSLQTLPVFVVGEDSGRNIRQLGNLKYLSGELKIQNLENVKDAEDAREAKLSEKANLRSLGLSWSHSVADSAEMLEGLQPHRNLRCLRVENYGGDRLPRWMGGCGLPNLVELSLINWRGREQVQLPGQFRWLKSLSVSGMDAVKCFGSDFCGGDAFPSLEEVALKGMANLEEWSVCNGGRQGALPSLKRLEVQGCPKLGAVPCFPSLSSLKLSGFEAENLPNRFFQNQLTYLSIDSCQNLESLSCELGNVAATLEELHIELSLSNWRGWEQVRLPGQFRSLKSLSVSGMDAVKCFGSDFCGGDAFPSLEEVALKGMANLEEWSVCDGGRQGALPSLKRLEVQGCPKLSAVPCFPSLSSLKLSGFEAENLPNRFFQNQLTYLSIDSCQNLESLSWELGNVAATLEELHIKLSLSNWRGWEQVRLPGQFRSLKSLSVSGMDAVKCFGSDFCGEDAFPSLEEVTLKGMANLEEWSVCDGGRQGALPSLKRLEVQGCPKLSAVPCFPSLSSLKLYGFEAENLPNRFFQSQLTHLSKLSIFDCQNLESLSWELGNVAATLKELHIEKCPKLVSLFPEEMQNYSPCLRGLSIYKCNGLTSLRLQSLDSLTSLLILSCENLAGFVGGMHHLTALQRLWIMNCPELPGTLADGMEYLTSLTHLDIDECAKVTHLPEGLKHATRLQSLHIEDLPNLSALPDWIGNLSSLEDLSVCNCPNLVSLPSGFQRLTNLQELRIYNCHPQLGKRCEKERGKDWHKISHIPDIHIHIAGSEIDIMREWNSCWISIRIMWTAILNSFWDLMGSRHDEG